MLDKSTTHSATATVEICLRKIIKTFNICENKSTLNCSKTRLSKTNLRKIYLVKINILNAILESGR